MMVSSIPLRILTLIAALPWQAVAVNVRTAAGTLAGTPVAISSASDSFAIVAATSNERRPTDKSERTGTCGPGLASTHWAPPADTPAALRPLTHALQLACTDRPSCALLCRFLI